MIRFTDYFHSDILTESLDTPVEFYLTDDTLLPSRIHGTFKLDDDEYGMSLEQSDFTGIYILSFYRILAKQKRMWAFKKPSHIRPGLSTLLKFAEASVPFVKTKLKGIMVKIPGQNSSRYIRFAERVLKRTYIKSFKVLPVQKNPDKKLYDWENLFISKIGINASTIFSDKKFKDYDFENEQILTYEVSAVIKPLKKSKTSVSTKPSKKYVVKNFLDVKDISIDSDILDKVTKVEKTPFINTEEETQNTLPKEVDNLSAPDKHYVKAITDKEHQYLAIDFFTELTDKPEIVLANILDYMITNQDKTSSYYVDEEKMLSTNDEYDFSNIIYGAYVNMIPVNLKSILYKKNLNLSSTYDVLPLLPKIKNEYKKLKLKKNKMDLKTIFSIFEKYEKPDDTDYQDPNLQEIFSTNINPDDLIPTVPGYNKFIYYKNSGAMRNSNNKAVTVKSAKDYIQDTLGYRQKLKKMPGFSSAVAYTGSLYITMNNELRDLFNLVYTDKETKHKNTLSIKTKKLSNMFSKIEPFPDSMWVYRGTTLPKTVQEELETGSDFVDPGFLSTSIRPSMGGGDQRFRIFIPKGSKIIPILDSSKFDTENEVILPPFSVIKIIRVDKFDYDTVFYTGIFIGSAYKSFLDQLDKSDGTNESYSLISEILKKKDKTPVYDSDKKYAGTTDAKTLLRAIKFTKKYLEKKEKK